MRMILFFSGLVLINYFSYSQCRVQKNSGPDGITIRYMSPERIGRADKFFMGASIQTSGSDYFVAVISIFPAIAENLKGNMTIKFTNNMSIVLQHMTSKETTFNSYPATMSIYHIDNNDLKQISSSNLKYILVQLENGVYQTVIVSLNPDVLVKQYNCLK